MLSRRIDLLVVSAIVLASLIPAVQADEQSLVSRNSGMPLAGVVVEPDGKPVAGAEVLMSQWGDVVRRTRSDDRGYFRINVPAKLLLSRRAELWALTKSGRVTWLAFNPNPLFGGDIVHLLFGKPINGSIRILGPDDRPVREARVVMSRLHRNAGLSVNVPFTPVPKALVDSFSATSDDDGNLRLSLHSPDDELWIHIATKRYGIHFRQLRASELEAGKTIKLPMSGRIVGKVIAKNAEIPDGLKISRDVVGLPYLATEVIADSQGAFEIRDLRPGPLVFRFEYPQDFPFRARNEPWVLVEAGKTTNTSIDLQRAVRVLGVLREKGTSKPISGSELSLHNQEAKQTELVVTDAMGRFDCFMLPGSVTITLATPFPGGLFSENSDSSFLDASRMATITVPDHEVVYDLPPIELVRGRSIEGRVVNVDGNGVPGAKVRLLMSSRRAVVISVEDEGINIREPSRHRYHDTLTAITNDGGHFVLKGIEPIDEVGFGSSFLGFEASSGEARTDGLTWIPDDAITPVALKVSSANSIALTGRVLDDDGDAVVGAEVEIRARRNGDSASDRGPISFFGSTRLRTDAEGRFRTPKRLSRWDEYRVEVIIGKRTILAQSEWMRPGPGGNFVLPDLVVHRETESKLK